MLLMAPRVLKDWRDGALIVMDVSIASLGESPPTQEPTKTTTPLVIAQPSVIVQVGLDPEGTRVSVATYVGNARLNSGAQIPCIS